MVGALGESHAALGHLYLMFISEAPDDGLNSSGDAASLLVSESSTCSPFLSLTGSLDAIGRISETIVFGGSKDDDTVGKVVGAEGKAARPTAETIAAGHLLGKTAHGRVISGGWRGASFAVKVCLCPVLIINGQYMTQF